MAKSYFLNLAGSNEKKNAGKEQGQDWSKVCWKEVKNE